MKVEIGSVQVRLRAPFFSSSGALERRALVLLRLEDDDGHVGFGEAAPLESYDGVTTGDVRSALEDCRGALTGANPLERAQLLADCSRLAVLPQALAAVDLALWDLTGRITGQPIWRLLGGSSPEPVAVNYTIAAADRTGAAAEARAAVQAGYGCVKAKVAIGDDPGRVAAIRAAAGGRLAIRLDANGAWSVEEATASLRVLEPAGIELCEEPVRGLEQTAELAAVCPVPIAIDETAANPGALDRRACEAICLKVARCGGITGLLDAGRRAAATGYDVYLASTFDGPLGIAAALHAAAVLGPARPCGLATLGLFEAGDPIPPRDGRMTVPPGPGLGDGLAEWYGELTPPR